MEHSNKETETGQTRPVFGSVTMIGGRAGLELPVSLVATAMANEIRSGSPGASNTDREAAGSCASRTQSGESAELIGQEELPLRAAMAARDEMQARDADEASPASRGGRPQRSTKATDATGSNAQALSATIVHTRRVPGRGGRPAGVERYPFGALTPVAVNEAGEMIGPCFLIPESDDPARHIAAARKRHAGKTFITRVVAGGTMVWRRK